MQNENLCMDSLLSKRQLQQQAVKGRIFKREKRVTFSVQVFEPTSTPNPQNHSTAAIMEHHHIISGTETERKGADEMRGKSPAIFAPLEISQKKIKILKFSTCSKTFVVLAAISTL